MKSATGAFYLLARWAPGLKDVALDARRGLSLACTLGLFLLFSPLISVLHEAIYLAMASLLRSFAGPRLLTALLVTFRFDPVHASVVDETMGSIESRGLAIAGPLGEALHRLAPGMFAPSDAVLPGAWTSAVVGDGLAVLADVMASVGAETALVAAGVLLLGLSIWRGSANRALRLRVLAVLGLLLQARGVAGLLDIGVTFDDLEAMGLSQVFTKLIPLDPETYHAVVVEPLRVLGPFLIPASLVFGIYALVAALALIVLRISQLRRATNRQWRPEVASAAIRLLTGSKNPSRVGTMLVVPALLSTVFLSQRLFPAQVSYHRPESASSQVHVQQVHEQKEIRASSGPVASNKAEGAGASKVVISGSNYNYEYNVNGRRQRIHGVGYNALYTDLSQEERAARYDRDFAQMRAASVNTILGWSAQQFDELTLTKAQEYGLGVVMPYRLPPDGYYAHPLIQEKITEEVLQWVRRFRSYPALRMWGIGNEVIHGMGKNPDTAQSKAFAEFYVKMVDAVHALDPDHPVTYRAAEDVYLRPMKNAIQNDNRARPWFIYGVNFFTFRICDALRDWKQKGVDVPLLVSEFAPAGFGREERPGGYKRMWGCIAEQPDRVLGGFAYVWNVKGPEALDRSFGLVNLDNTPTDGSLAALGEVFRSEPGPGN